MPSNPLLNVVTRYTFQSNVPQFTQQIIQLANQANAAVGRLQMATQTLQSATRHIGAFESAATRVTAALGAVFAVHKVMDWNRELVRSMGYWEQLRLGIAGAISGV